MRLKDGTELRSDLLADATGPSTIVPEVLEEAGLGAVQVERVLWDTTHCGCIMEAPPAYQVRPPPNQSEVNILVIKSLLSYFSILSFFVIVIHPISTQ